MAKYALFIDSFSEGLDEMPVRKQRSLGAILCHLRERKRFSVFEATATPHLAQNMDWLNEHKLIEVDNSPGFPWSKVKLTPEGEVMANQYLEDIKRGNKRRAEQKRKEQK